MRILSRYFLLILSLILAGSAFAGDSTTITFTGSRYTRTDTRVHHSRGRQDLSFVFEETGLIGITNDESIFFTVPASDITNCMLGARLGFEGVGKSGLGFKFAGGYQRLFYSSIGIEEAAKNLAVFDLFLEYFFRDSPHRWDPYVAIGPTVIISSINQQAYLSAGVGSRFFLNKHWSLKLETSGMSEFSGIWGRLMFGLGYHF